MPYGAGDTRSCHFDVTCYFSGGYVAEYPKPLVRLIEALSELPGVGERTAERLAFHILKQPAAASSELLDSIREAKTTVRHCKQCFNLTQQELCSICSDSRRQRDVLCVVEAPRDLIAIEKTGAFHGLYHCLLGRIAPLDGVDESGLTVDALVKRCSSGEVKEVVLATNPNIEGDATALAVARALTPCGVKITRLARGLPAGHELEYLSGTVMEEAFSGRLPLLAKGGAP